MPLSISICSLLLLLPDTFQRQYIYLDNVRFIYAVYACNRMSGSVYFFITFNLIENLLLLLSEERSVIVKRKFGERNCINMELLYFML